MRSRYKRTILVVVIFFVIAGLIFIGKMVSSENNRINIPDDPTEALLLEIVEMVVIAGQNIGGEIFFGSEEIAKEYARILYTEHFEGFAELNGGGFEITVTHYEEFGVWLARLTTYEFHTVHAPWIVFRDSDGKILMYFY